MTTSELVDAKWFCNSLFSSLPKVLNNNTVDQFIKACEKVDSTDKGPYVILMPFHHLSWSWDSAWAEGFTWTKFLKDIIEAGCTLAECMYGEFGPKLLFKKPDSSRYDFSISVVHCD